MENKKFMRSKDQKIAGVCAGIAEYFGWDTSIVRIVYALATLFTCSAGLWIYLILWLVIPVKQG